MFPDVTGADDSYYHYSRLRVYILEMCEVLTSEEEVDRDRLDTLAKQFLDFQTQGRPLNFLSFDPENALTVMDRNFTEMCALMEGNGSAHPDQYTVIQFYAKINYLQKDAARKARAGEVTAD